VSCSDVSEMEEINKKLRCDWRPTIIKSWFKLGIGFVFICPVEVEVNLRPTVSRPVCLGVRHPSGTCDQFFFLLEISFRQLRFCYFVAPSLTRGRFCKLLYCFWALPDQSLMLLVFIRSAFGLQDRSANKHVWEALLILCELIHRALFITKEGI
jgi:hypothetical protein